MKYRIAEVRKAVNMNQVDFAASLNLTKNYISLIENGNRVPSDRTIKDICDKFHISEDWLRYGEGEMFLKRTREEEIAAFMGSVLDGPNNFKKRLIAVLANLEEDDWELLEEMALKLAEEEKENPGQE